MEKFRKKVYRTIQIGHNATKADYLFDVIIITIILLSLFLAVFQTFEASRPYHEIIKTLELVTSILFAIEYGLRIWTAKYLYPEKKELSAIITFMFSFFGIIDLLTFLPYFIPFIFPSGAVVFKVFRIFRVLKLFRINTKYDAFNVIVNVLSEKKMQLFSSILMILVLMIASSLCMYNLEHEAQPEAFKNAFSGLWWSMSALLTVGYGDIYPITLAGKAVAIFITFLGVGMVAIPTGIISAGFVEQYSKLKTIAFHSEERELKFVTSTVYERHPWNGKEVKSIVFPPQLILVMVKRKDEALVPKGNLVLKENDILILGAKHFKEEHHINLREIIIKEKNPWVGQQLKDLDISRQEIIVMIRRKNKMIIPNGSTFIMVGDSVHIYSKIEQD